MDKKIRPFILGAKLGMVLFPCFFALDYYIYPEDRIQLLIIRLGISLYLAAVGFNINQMNKKYHLPIIFTSIILSTLAISCMCIVTGDGFNSDYYSGLLQVFIVTIMLYTIRPMHYALILAYCVIQHFVLLSFLPWDWAGFLIQLFAVGGVAVFAIFVQQFIFKLVKENQSLKGFIPICANCKKIRDDSGYWNQIEAYIQSHSEAEFTHSMCPECSDHLYGGQKWYIRLKEKKKQAQITKNPN